MGPDVFAAVLLAAAVHAGWNALVKRGRDALLETTLIHAWVAVPLAPLLAWLPAPGALPAACLVASAAIHCLYLQALAAAYRHGELSLAYPVMRGSAPMLTALLAGPLFDEWPSPLGWAGVLAVCVGVLAIGFARVGAVERAARARSLRWAGLTAATIVAYTLVDSVGARASDSPWTYAVWLAVLQGPTTVAVVAMRRGRALLDHARERGLVPLFAGIGAWGGYAVALWAMTHAPVAHVAALRESSVLFALLIARFALRERFGPMRWAGAASIVAGAALLRLA